MTPGERVKGFIERSGPLKLLPVRCNYCDRLPTEHTETCPETAIRRLAAENELLRAKCAEINQFAEYVQLALDTLAPYREEGGIAFAVDEWAKRLLQANPGQALLKYVKALERVRELLATFCEPIRIEIEERGEVGDDYDRFWRGQLAIAEKALAACEDGQEELK